ncbi:MAG: ABC transporter permease [Thiothrix sp.]|nr:ABC transporter permease [Thiothrix sp.]HPQ96350.1 ABC transporter permease [Thiolinea sp.]
MLNPLLLRASWRFFSHHPWQLWLTLLSIALGTAVMVAVDIANQSARYSFGRSVNALSGSLTHELTAASGLIPDTFYRQLRVEWGERTAVPVVRVALTVQGLEYTLLGTDPFARAAAPGDSALLAEGTDLRALLLTADAVLVPQSLAEKWGVGSGQSLEAEVHGQVRYLRVVGVLPEEQDGNLLLADIAVAQALAAHGRPAGLDAIQLQLAPEAVPALTSRLPPGMKLEPLARQQQVFDQMTAAFSTNLSAMSLLAVLVGSFLVYNTMTFSVLQRRPHFAIGRMLGVTGALLFRHLLLEALVLGLLGSVLGLVLGVMLGQGLLVLVTQTLSDLYVDVGVRELLLTPWQALRGIGVTLGVVLLATLAPALEAGRVSPLQVQRSSGLEQLGRRLGNRLLLGGVGVMLLGAGLILLSERSLLLGFLGLFVLVLGYGLCLPRLLQGLLTWLLCLLQRTGFHWRLLVRGVEANLSRTSLALIALSMAVAATVGVSLMIGSFRASVADWLGVTLSSDLYVSAVTPDDTQVGGELDPRWLVRIQALPGVASVTTGHRIRLNVDGMPLPVLVTEPGVHSRQGYDFIATDGEVAWERFVKGEGILVSEPFAYHRGQQVGDRVSLSTGQARAITLPILGVFRDYSATQGMLVLPQRLYARYWADPGITTLGMVLQPGADAVAVQQQLESWVRELALPGQRMVVRSNQAIRARSLQVFDRTFAVTQVLRVLVLVVAFVGVFSALMGLFLERGRDYAVLRATGLTPVQLRWLVTGQAALIGLLAGLLSLPLGWLLSLVLIEIINLRSFGWTMQLHFFPLVPLQALLLSVLAALVASVYPVYRIGQLSVGQGLRGE